MLFNKAKAAMLAKAKLRGHGPTPSASSSRVPQFRDSQRRNAPVLRKFTVATKQMPRPESMQSPYTQEERDEYVTWMLKLHVNHSTKQASVLNTAVDMNSRACLCLPIQGKIARGDISKRYKALAKVVHPDKNAQQSKSSAGDAFKVLRAAYQFATANLVAI
jgi:hypothetical protein